MAAVDEISPRVDAGVCEIDLRLIRLVVKLLPPVESTDYILRAVVNELLDRV